MDRFDKMKQRVKNTIGNENLSKIFIASRLKRMLKLRMFAIYRLDRVFVEVKNGALFIEDGDNYVYYEGFTNEAKVIRREILYLHKQLLRFQ